jgi:tetratricopeptide (TPR) repeat protein
MNMMMRSAVAAIVAFASSLCLAQQENQQRANNSHDTDLVHDRQLFDAYVRAEDNVHRRAPGSIEAAEKFIREHKGNGDLCGGLLLEIARWQASDPQKAIATYQRAIKEYGDTHVPARCAPFTIGNSARLEIAKLERALGHREKALAIFAQLMALPPNGRDDLPVRAYAITEYQKTTQQADLKVNARIAAQGAGPFPVSGSIPVTVTVTNPATVSVTFQCLVKLEQRQYVPLIGLEGTTFTYAEARNENKEMTIFTLPPGGQCVVPVVFAKVSTRGIGAGNCTLAPMLNGIPCDANTVEVKLTK